MRHLSLVPVALLILVGFSAQATEPAAPPRWSKEQAATWYDKQPWIVGCDFLPSSAINQLEMWQADTFDPETIDRELGLAESIGMNAVRVYLHDIAWEQDPKGFKARLSEFLGIASKHRIRPIFVFFDDCWNDNAKPGKQPAPVPGVHNSGWVRSPGSKAVNDPTKWGRLERYVTDLLTAFGKDERVLMWDLYNEPGNSGQDTRSLPLLKATFGWAWAVRPEQPLTVGLWYGNKELNDYQLSVSDVVTFHNYSDANNLRAQIRRLKKTGYPLICTEWMARTANSRPDPNLRVFKETKVGCLNWGLVSGKSNTIFPWGSKKGTPEPKVWFHDLFRPDGTPFDAKEIALFRELTGRGTAHGINATPSKGTPKS
jgi:hypothetical protein